MQGDLFIRWGKGTMVGPKGWQPKNNFRSRTLCSRFFSENQIGPFRNSKVINLEQLRSAIVHNDFGEKISLVPHEMEGF